MGYIEDNLQPGEQIVYKTQLHKIIFMNPVIFLLSSIFLFFTGISGIAIGTFVLLFLFVPSLANALITRLTSEFAVTNKRILIKVGWIRRNTLELLNSKIEGIGVSQGILGRIFNFGTISTSGVGTSKQYFKNIENPLEFKQQVYNQISK